MFTIPAPLSAVLDVAQVAVKVLHQEGQIRLGMFIYALKHGSKHKYGSLLEAQRKHFVGFNDEQLLDLYELILGALHHGFPGMTCGIERWPLQIGYTVATVGLGDSSDVTPLRLGQRALEMKLGRHPDARTSTRGTRLPGTTWYLPTANPSVTSVSLPRAA